MKLRSNRVLTKAAKPVQQAKVVKNQAKAASKSAHAHNPTAQGRNLEVPKVGIDTTTTGVNSGNTRDHPWRPYSPWKDKGKFEADVAQYESQCKDGIDRWGYPARNWYRRFFTPKGEIFPPEGLLSYHSPTDPQERWANRERAYTESSYPPAPIEEPKFPENRKFRNTSVVESPDSFDALSPAFKVAQDIPTYGSFTQTKPGTSGTAEAAAAPSTHTWSPPAPHQWTSFAPFSGWTRPPGYQNHPRPGWAHPSQRPEWPGQQHQHHPVIASPVWNGPAPPIITTYSPDGRSVCRSQSWHFTSTDPPHINGIPNPAVTSMFPNGVIPQQAKDVLNWMSMWNQGNANW